MQKTKIFDLMKQLQVEKALAQKLAIETVAAYKESEGLPSSSGGCILQVWISPAITQTKTKYLDLQVEENPCIDLPKDKLVSMETHIDFNDNSTSLLDEGVGASGIEVVNIFITP